jgi:pimeloyl-ACP methyl ester carboxylesterase
VRLSGELLAPAGGGRHPAVVMIGGSGAATREPYREQAEFLAEHGVAALIYDKRGAGDSGGSSDYRYSDLAGDARAAVEMLHTRSEVRPESVGVWGFGEGASIAPMVAAGYPDVAAVMVVSPSALAPASQQEWAVRRALSVGGADAGVDAVSRYYAVASDASSPDLRADPSGAWRSVSQPVLAVWGSADRLVPIHDSAVALQGALTSADALEADRLFRRARRIRLASRARAAGPGRRRASRSCRPHGCARTFARRVAAPGLSAQRSATCRYRPLPGRRSSPCRRCRCSSAGRCRSRG